MKCRHPGRDPKKPCEECAAMTVGEKLATIIFDVTRNVSTASVAQLHDLEDELADELDDALSPKAEPAV